MANVSLRQKTAEVRRRHILNAAITVFAERGFRGATIRDVAIAAGVSDGTIYNAFNNKAALLVGILDPLEESVGQGVPAHVEIHDVEAFVHGSLEHRLAAFTPQTLAMLRVVLSEALIDPDIRRLFLNKVISPAVKLPTTLFETLMAEGRIASSDSALTLRSIMALVLGVVMLRLLGEEQSVRRADEMPGLASQLLLHGLMPRPATRGRR